MISVLAVLLASMAMVNGQPAMPGMGMPGMPAPAIGQGIGQGMPQGIPAQAGAAPAQQTSTNAMNVGPSVFSQEQIQQVQQDYARRVGMDPRVAQQLDAQLMADIANQRTAGAAAPAQQGFRAMQMNGDLPLNGFGAARQAPLAQSYTNQQMYNPLGNLQNPLGQNPIQNPLGQNPYGQNPLGQNPLGQNPVGNLGGYPGAVAATQQMMGVDRNFLSQLMNQPQMQQYQRSLNDMGYATPQPMMSTQPMMTTQQMAAPYATQSMDSPYTIQQMNMPGMMGGMGGMNNFMANPAMNPGMNNAMGYAGMQAASTLSPNQQSMGDVNSGFSNLLSGLGAGMSQGGQPINLVGRNIAAGPPQTMASEAIPTQGNLFATIPGVGRVDLGIPRVVPAGQNARVQAVNAATSPQSGSTVTPMRTQIPTQA